MHNPFERALAAAPDYVASYLSGITPEAFLLDDATWHLQALNHLGKPVIYTLRIDTDAHGGDTVREVTVNGEVVTDLPELARRPETVLDWYDAIVTLDESGREAERQDPRWSGDDLSTEFERIEHRVVGYSEQSVRLEAFDDAAALETYLNTVLSATPLRVEVTPVASWPGLGATTFVEPGQPDRYTPIPYSTDIPPVDWYAQPDLERFGSYVYATFADASAGIDAADSVTVGADTAYRISEVPDEVEFGDAGARTEWWALRMPVLDLLLLVSRDESTLDVTIDNDGSTVVINNHSRRTFARRYQLEQRYQRRWGRLADDSVPHSDEEISAAISTALQAIGEDNAR